MRCLHQVELKSDNPLLTDFLLAEYQSQFWSLLYSFSYVLVSYFVDPAFPTYHLSVTLAHQNRSILYHSQRLCNNPSSPQLSARLITCTAHSCCCILPYANEFEIVLCESNEKPVHSPSAEEGWRNRQSRRQLQERKYPTIFSNRSGLPFISSSSENHRWFSVNRGEEFQWCAFSVNESGIDSDIREFHQGFGGIHVVSHCFLFYRSNDVELMCWSYALVVFRATESTLFRMQLSSPICVTPFAISHTFRLHV